MMNSTMKMRNRKVVSRKILDSGNDRVFTEIIAVMKAHSDCFGGVILAVDAWKNIKKQSLFGQMLMFTKDYLLYDMEDVTSKTHDSKFMVEKIYEIIEEIKEKYDIVVIAVVLDGAGECCKAPRLINGHVDCKNLIFNMVQC